MKKLVRCLGLCAALCAVLPTGAQAPVKGSVQLTNVTQQEVEVDEGGKKSRKLIEPGKMVPGDELVYTIHYRNEAPRAAERVVVNNPVPQQTRLRAGSAEGEGTEIDYSVDGGKTYGALDKLGISTQGSDAPRPATAADVTHLRWTLKNSMAPGASGFVRFRAVML